MQMKFDLEKSEVTLVLPLNLTSPPISSTGKSLLIAKEGGVVVVEGVGKVRFGLNLSVPNPAYVKTA